MKRASGSPRRVSRIVALALVLSAWSVLPGLVRADAASESQLQFEIGSEFYRQRRYPEAIERFLASYRLVPNANVAFNIAQTYALLRRDIDVYNWCEVVVGHSPPEALRTLASNLRDRVAPRVAVIDVVSTPPAAEIFVDREDLGGRGNAPRRLAVEPGPRTVILRVAGHHDATVNVIASVGTIMPAAGELRPIVSHVRILSEPAGARVTLGARDLGVSPVEVDLPIGTHRLRFSLDRYSNTTEDVVVSDEAPREVSARLARASGSFATLTIEGAPAGAHVRLGGRAIGTVPLTRSDLSPGTAEVEITTPGRDAFRSTLVLEAASATRVRVELRPPPSWSWPVIRVVLWTASGVALVTGGVLGGVALSQRSAFYEDPTRNTLDSVGTYALAADILFGTGALMAIGTLVANFLLSPPRATEGHVEVER